MSYRVTSLHAETISTGATFAPGENATGVNPKNEHDKALIDDGKLVEVTKTKRAKKASSTEKE